MRGKHLFNFGISVIAVLLLCASNSLQQTDFISNCISQTSGSWSASGTWTQCAGGVPQNGDSVTIMAGHTVVVNTNTNVIASLTVNGTLTIGNNNSARTLTISGSVLVHSGGTIQPYGLGAATVHQLLIGGNFTNHGSFFIGSGNPKIYTIFNGTSTQIISGSTVAAFYDLMVYSGATLEFPATTSPTIAHEMVNNGTVQQTRPVNAASVQFLTISTDRYRGVDISTNENLGNVTVKIRGNSGATCTNTGNTSPDYVSRCYEITPTIQGSAQVTLWALASEQNDIPTADLAPYRYTGSGWAKLTNISTGSGSNGYVFSRGDTTGFSAFLLGDTNFIPTAVKLHTTSATQTLPRLWFGLVTAITLLLASWFLYKPQLTKTIKIHA